MHHHFTCLGVTICGFLGHWVQPVDESYLMTFRSVDYESDETKRLMGQAPVNDGRKG